MCESVCEWRACCGGVVCVHVCPFCMRGVRVVLCCVSMGVMWEWWASVRVVWESCECIWVAW